MNAYDCTVQVHRARLNSAIIQEGQEAALMGITSTSATHPGTTAVVTVEHILGTTNSNMRILDMLESS